MLYVMLGKLPFSPLVRRELLYNVVLVSATHKHESVIGVHMAPPSGTSLPHPHPIPPL